MQDLLIRNTLDIMHCEKNLCENIVKHLWGEKDYLQGRIDFEEMKIILCGESQGHYWMPHAPFTLKVHKKKKFWILFCICKCLQTTLVQSINVF
jgi:hypothetical protein